MCFLNINNFFEWLIAGYLPLYLYLYCGCSGLDQSRTVEVQSHVRYRLGYLTSLDGLLVPLPVPPGVDLRGERILVPQSNLVGNVHFQSKQQTRRLAVPERSAEEVHGATQVHRRACNVEWEARHRCVHQDAKVVSQVSSGQSQSPHGRKDENAA